MRGQDLILQMTGCDPRAANLPSGAGPARGSGHGNPAAQRCRCTRTHAESRRLGGRSLRTMAESSARRKPMTGDKCPWWNKTSVGSAPSHRSHHAATSAGVGGACSMVKCKADRVGHEKLTHSLGRCYCRPHARGPAARPKRGSFGQCIGALSASDTPLVLRLVTRT